MADRESLLAGVNLAYLEPTGGVSNRCLQGVGLISYCPLSSEGNTKNQQQIISGYYSEAMIDDVSLITY